MPDGDLANILKGWSINARELVDFIVRTAPFKLEWRRIDHTFCLLLTQITKLLPVLSFPQIKHVHTLIYITPDQISFSF